MDHTKISAATVRDLSYIAARMRLDDRAEVDCQHPGWTPFNLAVSHMAGMAWTVEWKGNPEAAFGVAEQRIGLWTAWSWGSLRMWRCVPAIVDFFHRVAMPLVLDDPHATRVEARSMAGNVLAERFLMRLGATRRCELPAYGLNNETFILWDWTRDTANVLFDPLTAQTEALATAA